MHEYIKAALDGLAQQYAAESTRSDFHHTQPVIYPVLMSVTRSLAVAEAKEAGIDSAEQLRYRTEYFMEYIEEATKLWLARWGNKY